MTKFERIQMVKALGLNTEDCILVTDASQLKHNAFIDQYDEFSIRTQWADGNEQRPTPHVEVISKEKLVRTSTQLLKSGLHLLIKDCIDSKDGLFCGAALKRKNVITFEIAVGPVTVRTVTHKGIIDIQVEMTSAYNCRDFSSYWPPLLALQYMYNNMASVPIDNVIFEFSWYKYSIGWKNERFICWEITKSGYDSIYNLTPTGRQYNTLLWDRYNTTI